MIVHDIEALSAGLIEDVLGVLTESVEVATDHAFEGIICSQVTAVLHLCLKLSPFSLLAELVSRRNIFTNIALIQYYGVSQLHTIYNLLLRCRALKIVQGRPCHYIKR